MDAALVAGTDEETFDVVDTQDRVVGQQLRSEVHRLKLLHRAAHVLVFNRHGELFLQKRALSKDSSPGLWDSSAAGHLQVGESYDDAAVRELHEELGVTSAQPLQRLFKLTASPATEYEFAWIYRCQHDGPFRLHPGEIETGGWFAPPAIDAWAAERPHALTSTFRIIWRELHGDEHLFRPRRR